MRFGGAAPDVRDFQEACRLATAKALQGPDPLRNAQVVQILASGRVSPQQAADVLGKRLQQKRPHKQYLAVRLIGDVLVAHPDLRPALVKHVLAAQKAPMNRYSNTLQEQQRFKAAANELLQGARPDGHARPAACSAAAHSPRSPGAAAKAAGAAGPSCQRQRSRELEKALVAATATASELAQKVEGASLELANGTGSAASVQHAGKAAELLQARFSQVLGQAGAHPPAERTVAGAISSLDELSASLQLRDQVLRGRRAGAAVHPVGAASSPRPADAFDELVALRT